MFLFPSTSLYKYKKLCIFNSLMHCWFSKVCAIKYYRNFKSVLFLPFRMEDIWMIPVLQQKKSFLLILFNSKSTLLLFVSVNYKYSW